MSLIEDGIIRQVHNEIRIFHIFALLLFGGSRSGCGGAGLIAAENCFHAGHQLFGIEGLYDIVVGAQLQPKDFVEDFALCGQHDDGHLGAGPKLPADLVAVHAGKHQVEKDQVGFKRMKFPESRLSVPYDFCVIAFFHQVQRDQFSNIRIVVYN